MLPPLPLRAVRRVIEEAGLEEVVLVRLAVEAGLGREVMPRDEAPRFGDVRSPDGAARRADTHRFTAS